VAQAARLQTIEVAMIGLVWPVVSAACAARLSAAARPAIGGSAGP
jgi:hypothetical protein